MAEKYVWITGASSGIGFELVKSFASKGVSVFATARRTSQLQELQSEFPKDAVIVRKCDVSSYSSVQECVAEFLNDDSRSIDCLINNAGITSLSPAVNDSKQLVDSIIQTNLLGAIYCIQSALPRMLERKQGMIINILSVVTKKIFVSSSAYSASKAGLKAYSDVLREEVRKNGVKVINVLPGATKTPIWGSEMLEKHASRMMHPADIAELIAGFYLHPSGVVPEEITLRPLGGDL